ncbi:hypothetical protein IFM51744_10056 [Aspergillus udagawae]|uniref:BTB domain-containing protein n=1 Tax=Aspergillus udagawae TaxID=91492 RepID=A0ABQ1BC81_9EURO|nr:hypothetical protein IFM51744_10056 [Aspergillus udagawae]GFF98263.1 hypothetical protein IFM53868_09716 [Aspergillus udagawae]
MSETLHIFDSDGNVDFVYSITDPKSIPDDNIKPELCNGVPAADFQTSGTGNQSAAAQQNGERGEVPSNHDRRVRIRVSAKHLTLASPVWKRMFTGPWKESQKLAAGKRVEIVVEKSQEIEVDAMLTLMNVIHGRGRNIPRKVTLNALLEIAVLVDQYECYEVVDVMADIWIDKLLKGMPSAYGKDIVSWIFISWVFQRPLPFTSATKIAATQSQQRIDPGDLPIPKRILDRIEEHRQDGVKSALDLSYELIADLRDGRKYCSDVCDALSLGLLIKQLHAGGQLPPLPATSVPNVSLMQLTRILQNTSTVRYCDKSAVESYKPEPRYSDRTEERHVLSLHGCSLVPLIRPILQDVQNRLRGFELREFKDESKASGGNDSTASAQ